jgi:hypothetical protein
MSKRWYHIGIVRSIAVTCVFLLASASSVRAEQLVLNLPDNGLFSIWVTSGQDKITVLPFTSRGHASIAVRIPQEPDQKLFVLDGKTGRLATAPLNIGPSGSVPPLALLVSDFVPIASAGADAAAAPPRAAVSALAHDGDAEADHIPETPTSTNPEDAWETPLATFLIGMALAGLCSWIFQKLMRRSQPAYGYEGSSAPAWESRELSSPERGAASERKRRPRYRVTKTGDRGSRRRSRAHMPRLVGTEGLAAGARFVLSTPTMSIGRDGDNEIVLAETKVSRRHARIERGMSGYITLIDEASANGVYVNGMRVEKAVLHQGDEIKIGDSYFRFEE